MPEMRFSSTAWMSPVDSRCFLYLRWTRVENQYTAGTMNRMGVNNTAASFQDISTRMRKAVPKVTKIRMMEVDESDTTSSSWLTSLDSTDMIWPVCLRS